MRPRICQITFLLFLLSVLFSGSVPAATLTVPSAQYPTIQSAIDASVNGDVVMVSAGTYRETLVWANKSISLQGQGIEQTYIEPMLGGSAGQPEGRCLDLSNVPASARIDGITFLFGSQPTDVGGAIRLSGSSPTIAACGFAWNEARQGGAIGMVNDSRPLIIGCRFENNLAADNGPTYSGEGGAICASGSQPAIQDCRFTQNRAEWRGGAIKMDDCRPKIERCRFDRNYATGKGGGLYAEFSTLNISNCLFWRNGGHPTDGYAHYNYYSTMTATNCTYAGNGIWNDHATLTLTNSISAPLSGWYSDWPVTSYLSTVTVTNSCITAGQSPWPGTGNINADPRFSDPSSGDFRLLENSPCVGAGSNAALPTDVITDLDGNPRVYGAFVDMGAFEVQVDTLPPVIQAPNEVRIYANNTTGMNVSFTVQATDGFDGPVPVTCSPASGTFFPIGSTTVTCTAVDSQGRQAQSTFLVKVLYCWSGFYEPEPDGLASYQSGSPVRIRFQLLQESAAITNLAAQFVVIPNGGGGQFSYIRYARGINKEYVAVWDTTGVPPGEYLIDVVLGDGELRNVTVRVW